MSSFIANVVHILAREFVRTRAAPPTAAEKKLAAQIRQILLDSQDNQMSVEVSETLDFADYEYVPDYDDLFSDVDESDEETATSSTQTMEYEEADASSSQSEYEPEPQKPRLEVSNAKKAAIVNFWQSGKTKPYSLSCVQNKFGKVVTSMSQLYRWKSQVASGGNFKEKMRQIWEHTRETFNEARHRYANVHDINIREFAMTKAEEIGLNQFTASDSWVVKFKKANRLVSRKITKIVTSRYAVEAFDLGAQVAEFRHNYFTEYQPVFSPHFTLNADQSSFQYEMHTGRTLDNKGVKSVLSLCHSEGAMSHSYTVMPTINMFEIKKT